MLKVGAATEVELKEKKHRIEDALSAARAGVEEGMVAGGGSVLIHALPALDKVEVLGDEAIGVDILRRALEEPLRQIAINAGQEGSVVVEEVRKLQPAAATTPPRASTSTCTGHHRPGQGDAKSEGRPVLATETVITDLPEKEKAMGMPPGMGGGGWTSSPFQPAHRREGPPGRGLRCASRWSDRRLARLVRLLGLRACWSSSSRVEACRRAPPARPGASACRRRLPAGPPARGRTGGRRLGARKMLAMKPVRTLKSPMPAMRRKTPMILPPCVTGYWSPYPTVVIVTIPHHSASPAVVMLAAGSALST